MWSKLRIDVTFGKHNRLIFDLGDIPIGYVLVEFFCTMEHAVHVGDLGDIPARDVLIEGKSMGEH